MNEVKTVRSLPNLNEMGTDKAGSSGLFEILTSRPDIDVKQVGLAEVSLPDSIVSGEFIGKGLPAIWHYSARPDS